jgi:NitT/TauT family transport system substrate-binding protein
MKKHSMILTVLLSLITIIMTACGQGSGTTSVSQSAQPAASTNVASAPASKTPDAKMEKVTLRLDYVLSGYHAPFYVALEKGYYKEAGLDVTIGEGKGSGVAIQNVASGSDTFAFADGGTMMSYVSKGANLRSVASIFRTSPAAVIYKASDKIKDPKDIANFKVGGAPGGATEQLYPAFLLAVGLDPNKNAMANLESSSKLTALIDGKVDGVLSLPFLQIPILESKGFKADAFAFADHGVNTPGLSIITSQATVDQKPEMVKAFVKASLKGFKDSKANPDEAIAVIKKLFPQVVNEPLFKQVLVGSFPLYESKNTTGKPLGYASEEDWNDGEQLIHKYIKLDKLSGAKVYITNDFIPKE